MTHALPTRAELEAAIRDVHRSERDLEAGAASAYRTYNEKLHKEREARLKSMLDRLFAAAGPRKGSAEAGE